MSYGPLFVLCFVVVCGGDDELVPDLPVDGLGEGEGGGAGGGGGAEGGPGRPVEGAVETEGAASKDADLRG